jgi:hypothetical protein
VSFIIFFASFSSRPEKFVSDVAVYRYDLALYETFKLIAVFFAQRIEGRRSNNACPKPRLRFILIARTHRRIHLSDIREIMEQHRQRDFSDKARPADEEDLLAFKYFCW